MSYVPWIAFMVVMFWTVREVAQAFEEDLVRKKSEILFKKLQIVPDSTPY